MTAEIRRLAELQVGWMRQQGFVFPDGLDVVELMLSDPTMKAHFTEFAERTEREHREIREAIARENARKFCY